MKNRFQIRELIFLGEDKESKLEFQDGLNVIYGKSNTGKSLIFSAIQYLFGKGNIEDFNGIEELEGYDSVRLFIETNRGARYSIERKISDEASDIKVLDLKKNTIQEYRPKDSRGNKLSISTFLTQITSTKGFKLKKNQRGDLINYTFDKEMLISMISETRIIEKKNSPFLTGLKVTKTSEISALKTVFTNTDDSECVKAEDPQIYKGKLNSNIDLLTELKIKLIHELKTGLNHKENIVELDSKISKLKEKISLKNRELSKQLEEKKSFSNKINMLNSKMIFSQEILKRLKLHKENLKSDAERLEFLIEGNFYLNQLIDTECPLCKNLITEDNVQSINEANSNSFFNIEKAYKREFGKIKIQLNDVEEPLEYHCNEVSSSKLDISDIEKKVNMLEKAIENETSTELENLYNALENLNEKKAVLTALNEKKELIKELDSKMLEITQKKNNTTPKCTYNKTIDEKEINKYLSFVKKNLNEWKYSEFTSIAFDLDKLDISIDSKPRTSNGKGHRAIQAASMTVSLLEYAISKEVIHPGFVIIDSPLLSLRERKTIKNGDEIISKNITKNFYEKLANKQNMQIIILENEEPPKNLEEIAKLTEFTKDLKIGRYGLL